MMMPARHPLPHLMDEVLRTHGRLLAATAGFGAEDGLTGAQMLVLTAVVNAQRAPTVPQIGRSLGHTRQSVQRIADALLARGFVATKDNPDHKRAPLLMPTEAGRAAHRRADDRSQSWIARVTEGIDPDELAHAAETLRLLRTRLEADAAEQRRSS